MDSERVGIAVIGAKGVPKKGLVKSWLMIDQLQEPHQKIHREFQGNFYTLTCSTSEDNEGIDSAVEKLIRENDTFVLVYSTHHWDTFKFVLDTKTQIQKEKGCGPAMVLVGIYSCDGDLGLHQVTSQTASDTAHAWNCPNFELSEPTKREVLVHIFDSALGEFINRDVWFYDTLKIVRSPKKPVVPETIKELDCYGFHLGMNQIPHGTQLARLRQMTTMNLSDNYLQAIPDLTSCVSLQKLFLSKNQIKHLEFDNLPQTLRELHIAENLIEDIGPTVSRLATLELLNIQKNRLLSISTEIHHLSSPKFILDCTGNRDIKFDLDFSISPKKIKLDPNFSSYVEFWKKYPGGFASEGKLLILGHGAAGTQPIL